MASHGQSPGSEPQSPQSSTTGYPLEVVLEEAMPGPSVRWGESSPQAFAGSWKRKREQTLYEEEKEEELEEEEEEEDEETPGALDILIYAGAPCQGQKRRRMWSMQEVEEEQEESEEEQQEEQEEVLEEKEQEKPEEEHEMEQKEEQKEEEEQKEKVEEQEKVGEEEEAEEQEPEEQQEEEEQEEGEENGDTVTKAQHSGHQPSPWSRGAVRRRRELSLEEQQEDEEQSCGLHSKRRRQESEVLPEHHKVFRKLLEDPVVRRFLAWDKGLMVSDKYLLAMVIAYFSRCGLFCWQIRRIHFFLALYLASDMEEDNQAPKQSIFSFLYGHSRQQRPLFHRLRLQLLRSMGWRTRVTREECEQIQAYEPELWVWGRDRTSLTYSQTRRQGKA